MVNKHSGKKSAVSIVAKPLSQFFFVERRENEKE